jgi:hypothetical protein
MGTSRQAAPDKVQAARGGWSIEGEYPSGIVRSVGNRCMRTTLRIGAPPGIVAMIIFPKCPHCAHPPAAVPSSQPESLQSVSSHSVEAASRSHRAWVSGTEITTATKQATNAGSTRNIRFCILRAARPLSIRGFALDSQSIKFLHGISHRVQERSGCIVGGNRRRTRHIETVLEGGRAARWNEDS